MRMSGSLFLVLSLVLFFFSLSNFSMVVFVFILFYYHLKACLFSNERKRVNLAGKKRKNYEK